MTGSPQLVIWGAGGHARVIVDILNLTSAYKIMGFLDDIDPTPRPVSFCDASILGGADQLDYLRAAGVPNIVLGFGNCVARLALAKVVRARGFVLPTVIHPRAIVAQDVPIGAGTVIAGGAVINPGARVGENVIVNTGATIDHECVIEEGAHICPGVHLAGNVTIGSAAWIGIGATVIQNIRIGAGATIGAGAVVLRDIPDNATAYGVPARTEREWLEKR